MGWMNQLIVEQNLAQKIEWGIFDSGVMELTICEMTGQIFLCNWQYYKYFTWKSLKFCGICCNSMLLYQLSCILCLYCSIPYDNKYICLEFLVKPLYFFIWAKNYAPKLNHIAEILNIFLTTFNFGIWKNDPQQNIWFWGEKSWIFLLFTFSKFQHIQRVP